MLENFLVVSQQVLILFILIFVGFVCGKRKMFSDNAAKYMTDIVLYIVTPCVIIEAFQREFNQEMFFNLGITILCAVLIHVGSILLCSIAFRGSDSSAKVLKFGTVFSNCGFMSIPLQTAVLGKDGVFYGAAFLAVYNIMLWTYGLVLMSGSKKNINAKQLILNPGIIGVVIGVLLYVLHITLPEIAAAPINYLANLNTPIPMIIIGYHLSKADLSRAFTSMKSYIAMFLRLLAVPALTLLIMKLWGIGGDILVSCIISCAAPVAAGTTMFATKFNQDTELSVSLVSASTLLSLATMPVMVSIAQSFA